VWEIRASGQFEENSEFAHAVPKNIITRSLGPNATVQTDFEGPFPLELGDTFLLCSDGLTGLVDDDEIGSILATLPPATAAQALTDLANLRGGHDNITVVVVRIAGPEMTTRVAGGQPLTIHRAQRKQRPTPALWVAASVCFLAALALAVLERLHAGLFVLAVGLISVLAAILQRWMTTPRGIALGESRRFGKGPYVTVDCPVNAEIIEKLEPLVDQLRTATEDEHLRVDLRSFDQQCQSAREAAAEGRFDVALKQYIQGISYMMRELRKKGRPGQKPPPEAFGL
jgi:protein phosphatase